MTHEKPPRTPSHVPLTEAERSELIPSKRWTAEGDIPRYQPPIRLSDFEAHIRQKDIYASIKAAILEEIEQFKAVRQSDRGR